MKYSTSLANPKSSIVQLDETFPENQLFGCIDSIFEHHYQTRDGEQSHIWFLLHPSPLIPSHEKNPFRDLNLHTMQVELWLPPTNETEYLLFWVESIEVLCMD